jgi:hypothetical protein
MSSSHMPGERLLSALRRELRWVGWRTRRRAMHEARDHLLCAVEDELAQGASPAEADERAVERFGDPVVVAARLRRAAPKRSNRVLPVTVGVAMMTGVLALPAGPVRENLTAPQAKAATPPRVSTERCAKAWNAVENARWRAYAVRLATRRAYVGGSVAMNPKDGVVVNEMCVVKLWLDRQAGHWQNAVYVYGNWEGGTAQYGTSWKHKPAPPHRARLRTPVQWSNAQVLPDGALVLHTGTSS